MRAGLLMAAALALVFTPAASAEESLDATACVTVWDPSGGIYAPRIDAGYCIGTVFAIVEKVSKPEAA
jgi:hypothetical protein